MGRRFYLIGHPLGHSLSPEIHAAVMRMAGVDGSYELLDTPPEGVPETVRRLLRQSDGFNVTIPHKKAVIPLLDGVSEAARRCNAVNTVFRGRGFNTDTVGFASASLHLRGARVLLLGTGGVADTMAAESVAAGASALAVSSRSAETARSFISSLRARFPDSSCEFSAVESGADALAAAVARCSVLLNGTPVGMWPRAGGVPVPPESMHPAMEVFDPVYCPTPTRLVLAARRAGARAVGGLPMLVHQAVAAQKIWNPGLDLDAMAIAESVIPELLADLRRKNPVKILLTGFMGAGKTTVGRILAARLGIDFVDLDSEIERAAGSSISSVFASSGEEGFRALETATARRVFRDGPSAVVAGGGGFPTREENRTLTRSENVLVFLLDAPFDLVWNRIRGDSSRPLSRSREETAALFERRAPVLRAFCDAAVSCADHSSPDSVAAAAAALLSPA